MRTPNSGRLVTSDAALGGQDRFLTIALPDIGRPRIRGLYVEIPDSRTALHFFEKPILGSRSVGLGVSMEASTVIGIYKYQGVYVSPAVPETRN